METPKKRSKKENFKGRENTKPFSKENQPTPEIKSQGWQKKKFTRAIVKEFLEGNYKLPPDAAKEFKLRFGIDPDNITVGAAVMMQQATLAMSAGKMAKQAAEFLYNQAYGQPKQEIEHSGEIQGQVINQIIIENPNKGDKD